MISIVRITITGAVCLGAIAFAANTSDAGEYYREGVFLAQLEKPYDDTIDPAPLSRPATHPAAGYDPYASVCVQPGHCEQDCLNCYEYDDSGFVTRVGKNVESRYNKLNRQQYFNHQRSHRNLLYPVQAPYHAYGYGYHETCWRKMEPNRCPCPAQPVPAGYAPVPGLPPTPQP